MKVIPHNYQYSMLWNLLGMEKGGIINAGYGLGKTIVILLFVYYKYKKYNEKSLICLPASTIPNYKEEIKKLNLPEELFGYTKNKGKRQEEVSNHPIVISSYEVLSDFTFKGENIILDECTMVKNYDSKRFYELLRFQKNNKSNLRFYGFTGAFNTVEMKYYYSFFELFKDDYFDGIRSPLHFLRVFFDEFIINSVYTKKGLVNIKDYRVKQEYKDILLNKMGEYVKTYDRGIYNTLPEHLTQIVYTSKRRREDTGELARIKNVYENLTKDNLILEQEISSGFLYNKDSGEVESYGYAKLKFAIQKIKELVFDSNENVLIFYNFKEEYKFLKKELTSLKMEVKEAREKDAVSLWNNKKLNVLLCHPQSGGRGLNLQAGGSVYMWITLPLSLELYQQAQARLHRQGQKESVIEIIILHSDIDVHVKNILTNKDYLSKERMEVFK